MLLDTEFGVLSQGSYVGSTAVVLLLGQDTMWVAHAGGAGWLACIPCEQQLHMLSLPQPPQRPLLCACYVPQVILVLFWDDAAAPSCSQAITRPRATMRLHGCR